MRRTVPTVLSGVFMAIMPIGLPDLPLPKIHPERALTPRLNLPFQQSQKEKPIQGGTIVGGGGHWSIPLRFLPPQTLESEPGGTGYGGAGKGDCPASNISLTAMVPKTERGVQGATLVGRPTFWFYVPYTTADNFSARFTLQNKQGQEIYKTTRPLPQISGIISIRLPPTAPPLQVNQSYRWTLQLGCSKPELSVWGWVQRVETPPAIATTLNSLTAPQKAALYAENGFWFDALTVIGEARRANPQDAAITNFWVNLLTQGKLDLPPEHQSKLEEIARQPIVR